LTVVVNWFEELKTRVGRRKDLTDLEALGELPPA